MMDDQDSGVDLLADGQELILALVAPIGTDKSAVEESVMTFAKSQGYEVNLVKVSDLLQQAGQADQPAESGSLERYEALMDLGDHLRGRNIESTAWMVMTAIAQGRGTIGGARVVHLIDSLKHPAEVDALRAIYRRSCIVLCLYESKSERARKLASAFGVTEAEVASLVQRDELGGDGGAQSTRKAYELGDFFLPVQNRRVADRELQRMLRICFGDPAETPTLEEYGMYLAHAAALRSGSLARQVGAAVLNSAGDVLAIGCNDAPRAGGGQPWGGDDDGRDAAIGYDANDIEKRSMVVAIMKAVRDSEVNVAGGEGVRATGLDGLSDEELLALGRKRLKATGVLDLTEYGRDVHAEMAALLASARNGVAVKGATLFTTTFPCHNCAKHIVAAGVSRVVYLEAYPKSRALDLHGDALELGGAAVGKKVSLSAYLGVGPRRFLDLFSMNLSSGGPIDRKDEDGYALPPGRSQGLRAAELMGSIPDMESRAARELAHLLQFEQDSPPDASEGGSTP